MAEEQEYKVIDKRRVRAESSEAEPATGTAGEEQPSEDAGGGRGVTAEEVRAAAEAAAQQAAAGGGELPALNVPDALAVCINMLAEVAWMKMGLIPNLRQEMERDLPQAKIAVDAVSDLVTRLEPLLGEPEKRDLQVMLSNLRINFVQQSQKGG